MTETGKQLFLKRECMNRKSSRPFVHIKDVDKALGQAGRVSARRVRKCACYRVAANRVP